MTASIATKIRQIFSIVGGNDFYQEDNRRLGGHATFSIDRSEHMVYFQLNTHDVLYFRVLGIRPFSGHEVIMPIDAG
jgi:hypothetical protein